MNRTFGISMLSALLHSIQSIACIIIYACNCCNSFISLKSFRSLYDNQAIIFFLAPISANGKSLQYGKAGLKSVLSHCFYPVNQACKTIGMLLIPNHPKGQYCNNIMKIKMKLQSKIHCCQYMAYIETEPKTELTGLLFGNPVLYH